MKPERVLAVVVGIIVVIAAVAAVVASRRDAVVYDADTPEGAVQAYLRAVIDDDHDAADAYLDPAADCDWADAGRVGRDGEEGDALRASTLAGARDDQQDVRLGAPGHEALEAVQGVAVAVFGGRRLDRRGHPAG